MPRRKNDPWSGEAVRGENPAHSLQRDAEALVGTMPPQGQSARYFRMFQTFQDALNKWKVELPFAESEAKKAGVIGADPTGERRFRADAVRRILAELGDDQNP